VIEAANPITHIFRAGRFPILPEWNGHAFAHDTVAIHLHEYAGEIRFGAERFSLQPGDITVSPPRRRSRYFIEAAGYHWCVHFFRARASDWRPERFRPSAASAFDARGLMRLIANLHARGEPEASASAERLLAGFLGALFCGAHEPDAAAETRAERAVQQVVERIAKSLGNPPSVAQLAEETALSPDYLTRRFKSVYGVGISRFILLKRIEEARYLLDHSTLPHKSIAATLGFRDGQHFNKQFRAIVGCSPSAFREKLPG